MKKIFYLLSSLMLVFTACDPMDEVYDELDAIAEQPKTVAITLTPADYQFLKGKDGVPAHVSTSFYFTSEQEAGAVVPIFLNAKYAHLRDKDAIDVTYNTSAYEGITGIVTVTDKKDYTVTEEDYRALGKTDGKLNFNSSSDIPKFFAYKYPEAVEGQVVVLTYDYYAGAVKTLTEAYYYTKGSWVKAYYVTKADYEALGKRSDFSSSDDNLLDDYFNMYLERTVFGAEAGEIRYVSYAYYNSSARKTEQRIMAMAYDGAKWITVAPTVTKQATLAFKKKNGTWVPDPIIRYTLVADNYIWISQQPELGTEAQRANLGDPRYLNFYQSWSGNDYYWSNEDIYKALAGFLKYKFPNAEVGSKYSVTYAYYLSGNKVNTVVFIKTEAGEFERFEE